MKRWIILKIFSLDFCVRKDSLSGLIALEVHFYYPLHIGSGLLCTEPVYLIYLTVITRKSMHVYEFLLMEEQQCLCIFSCVFECSTCTVILLEGLAVTVAFWLKREEPAVREICGTIVTSKNITLLLCTPLCCTYTCYFSYLYINQPIRWKE